METSTPPPPSTNLSTHLYHQLVYTLTDLLPPPLDGSPGALRARNYAAIAKVAAMLPVNANETDLAAQSIAARAQAEDILRLLRENADDLALVIRLNAQYASMVRTSLSVHAHLLRVAEQSMLKVTDREIEWQEAARLKAAPVAAPAPAPQQDQTTGENVPENNTNPHSAAFETWMSEQPWNQAPGSQDETGLSKLLHEVMAGSRLAGRELPADARESPGRTG
jgi:hypothetical protein